MKKFKLSFLSAAAILATSVAMADETPLGVTQPPGRTPAPARTVGRVQSACNKELSNQMGNVSSVLAQLSGEQARVEDLNEQLNEAQKEIASLKAAPGPAVAAPEKK